MRGTFFWLLVWLVAVTLFAWSNQTIVTVRFWQWPLAEGPLGMIVVAAGVLGVLLTYVSSLAHHLRQARYIRTLEANVRAQSTSPAPASLAGGPAPRPVPPGPAEETRKLP